MPVVVAPISKSDGADRIWMFETNVVSFSEAIVEMTDFLTNPAKFVNKVIKKFPHETPEDIVDFNPALPIVVLFQYGLKPRNPAAASGHRFLYKGEYGTNMISVICPSAFLDSDNIDIARTMEDLWQAPLKVRPRLGESGNPSGKHLDVTILSNFNRFYAHFDIDSSKPGKNYFDCFAYFVVCPNYIVDVANLMSEDARVSIVDGSNLIDGNTPMPTGTKRMNFSRLSTKSAIKFEMVYLSPPTVYRRRKARGPVTDPRALSTGVQNSAVARFSDIVETQVSVAMALKTADPCLKFQGEYVPPPPGYIWQLDPDSANLSGWTLALDSGVG